MLLDRKRINRVARWFAIILAISFALGTVFLGVGSSTGNIFSGCSKNSQITGSSSFEDREEFYRSQIEQNPQDKDSMLQLASLYSDDSIARYDEAVEWLNRYLELDPNNNDVRLRVASIMINRKQDNESAVKVLSEVTAQDPANAMAFLLLGQAAKGAGQNQTAILAWSRYLELAPTSEYAELIRQEIATLSTQPAIAPQTPTVPAAGAQVPATPGS